MLFANRPPCEGVVDLTLKDSDGTGGSGTWIDWHPSSNYFAVGTAITDEQLKVYSFDGTTLTEAENVAVGNSCYGLNWHPNGNFLAVTNLDGHDVKVYSWNGTDTLAEVETVDLGYDTRGVAWHPDGDFLAVMAQGGTKDLTVFSWNGSDTLTEVETVDLTAANPLNWSHDGNYLLVGASIANEQIRVYSWNGSDTLALVDTYDIGGDYEIAVVWSLSDDYVFVAGANDTKTFVVLSFNGTALAEISYQTLGAGAVANCSLSRGGNYVYVARTGTGANEDWVRCYHWNETAETLTLKDSITFNGDGVTGNGSSYQNNYFAYCRFSPGAGVVVNAATTGLIMSTRDYCIT